MSRRLEFLARLCLSVACLAALVWIVDAQAAYGRLAAMDLRWMGVGVVCLSLQTVLMALRWQITARALGTAFGLVWAVREYYLSQLVNLFLPGGVLGDAGRALRTPRAAEDGLTRAAHAVMIERLAGQVGVLLVGLAGLALALVPGGIVWPQAIVRGVLLGAVLLGILLVVIALVRVRLAPVRRFGLSVRRALLSRGVILPQLALSVAAALLMIAAFAACAQATGTTLSPEAALTLVPLVLTAMMIPLSLGGWGLREGAAAALFPLIGAAGNAGVAAGVAYGLALTLACLPGLLLLLLRVRMPRRPLDAASAPGQPMR